MRRTDARDICEKIYLNSENVHQQRKDCNHLNEEEGTGYDGENIVWSKIIQKVVRNQGFVQIRKGYVEYHANVPDKRAKKKRKVGLNCLVIT